LQTKLLRFLQTSTIQPVGATKPRKVNVRIICATNRDLRVLTQQGLFREDLFYRLAVVPIHIPPLRDRMSDVPLLVEHFLDKFSTDTGRRVREIGSAALELLMHYPWPGNVRELGNALQYGIIKCRSGVLDASHLPPEIREHGSKGMMNRPGPRLKLDEPAVADALRQAGGNRSKAARLLRVSRTTLYRFLADHDLSHDTTM